MSRQELAEAVNGWIFQNAGRDVCLDANYVGKLERGEHRWPNDLYRRAFRAVLAASTDADLGFFIIRGIGIPEVSAAQLALLHADPAPADDASRDVGACLVHGSTLGGITGIPLDDGNAVKRRDLLALVGMTAPAAFASQAEFIRAIANASTGHEATELDADDWERVAYDYAHEVGRRPAERVLPNLLGDIHEISILIEGASDSTGTRLRHVAAQLAALVAINFTTLADSPAARRWWRSAGRLADRTNDARLSSLVRGRQAVFGLYEERPSASILAVADEAIRIDGARPGAGAISGYAAKAQVLARLGHHEAAISALHDLERLFERLPDEVRTDRFSQWGLSIQRYHHVASFVYTFAGDVERASRAQEDALASYPVGGYQGRSQIELYRAGSLIRSGELQEGSRHLVNVFTGLPTEHRHDGLLHRTALTALSLAPAGGHPSLAEARELLALTAEGS